MNLLNSTPENTIPPQTVAPPQYWAFRVDQEHLTELDEEFQNGRLRQGWGWDLKQNLKKMEMDEGAGRNRRMLNVKNGDRILIPHLPCRGQITIAEATEDWDSGYTFSLFPATNDHGHIFPVRPLENFNRHNSVIPASLRSTFRNPSRFWNISYLREDIEKVLRTPVENLSSSSSVVDRWQQDVIEIVAKTDLRNLLFQKAVEKFGKHEWEYLLVDILQRLNPAWSVQRTGGITECEHGTDILITIPDIFRIKSYGVAVQVKDYTGVVGKWPIDQILKAKSYWKEKREIEVVEHVVVLIGCVSSDNNRLILEAKDANVRLVWSSDIQSLILKAASQFVSDSETTPVVGLD